MRLREIRCVLLLSVSACRDAPPAQQAVGQAPPAAAVDEVALEFRMDGPPAFPKPDREDRNWKEAGYDPLAPSREDGKPTFSNDWFLNHPGLWRQVLAPYAGRPGLRYLEVGVFEGQAFLWMFENVLTHPSSTGVAIDVFFHEGLEARWRENLERAGIAARVETRKGFSNEMLRPLERDSFDIVYVDASHSANDVMRDAVLCWDLLKRDGVLIFDDYAYRPRHPAELRPQGALDAFVTAFRNELDVLHRSWQLIVRKRTNPCPGCSTLGPYHFYWDDNQRGVLFDPRTKARVPLSDAEAALVEQLLRSRPSGKTEFVLPKALAEGERVQALRRKLGI